jgi:kinesin family protein 18/19
VYGATGAGKTFTMLGSDEMPGIISLTMRSLFEKIEEIDDKHFDIGISYLEVGLLVHKNA